MISIYPSPETLFANNGIKILKPLKAVIRKEDNGDFYLDLRDDLENLDYYQSGNIIRVPTPWGNQCFRLKNPEIENKKINVRAQHLYFDSQNYIIKDSYVVDKNCNDALDHLNSATDITSPFTTLSDVPTVFSYRCVRKSLAEAVSDVIERWGGHLVRNNWNIEVRQNSGQDRGVNLEYGKNIINIQASEDWSNVVTKLMPVGKDGLLLEETWLEIDEQLYEIPYTKVVSFDQSAINQEDFSDGEGNIDEGAYQAALVSDLRTKGLNFLNENSMPKVNYSLDAYLKNISDVGDTIWVKHPKCKIDIITKVIALEFDVISQIITKVEFGNFKNNLKNLLNTIENKITEKVEVSEQNVTAKLEKELVEATNAIKDKLGASYVVYEGDKLLILDALPKEEAKNVIMINSGGIGFSSTGINGIFNSAWTISGELDMQNINVINLVADMIKGGTLKLGSSLNESGICELFDNENTLIVLLDKDGITINCSDGRTIKMNAEIGFCAYDTDGTTPIYWSNGDEFHMKKCVVEDEITIANGLRFIPISNSSNTGIGVVAMV
jgi:phage minor structural protein